jgi:hypothetical protein
MRYLLYIICLLPTLGWSATLTSSVDRNQITINDMLQFQLRYDERADTDQLDLSALQVDWEVLDIRPQSSSSVQITNGNRTQEVLTVWSITLAPRKQGTLSIPTLTIDGAQSNAISIQVNEQGTSNATEQPMRVTIDAQPQNAVIDQQVIVTIELSLLSSTQISNLGGEELQLADAQIELLAEDDLVEIENGIEHRILRWTYAVFPQQAGELVIPRQTFTGVIPARQRRGPFDPFGQRGQRINARSDNLTVNVSTAQEKPGAVWFPADSIKIEAYWSDPTRQLRVGEPLTRTIEITALGQRAELIPPLPASAEQSYKAYQDQPQLDTQILDSSVIGGRKESQAIVPSAAGPLSLPAQLVIWWNTQTQQWDETRLAAEIVEVLPAAEVAIAPNTTANVAPINTPSNNTGLNNAFSNTQNSLMWQVAAITLLAITLIQTWFLYRRPTFNSTVQKTAQHPSSQSEKHAWSKLLKALDAAGAKQVRHLILKWSRTAYPDQPSHTSDMLAARSNSQEFKQALRLLDRSIYSGNEESIDREAIKTGLQNLRNSASDTQSKQDTQALPALYPNV